MNLRSRLTSVANQFALMVQRLDPTAGADVREDRGPATEAQFDTSGGPFVLKRQ